jgi:hypothetical protein
MSTKTKLRLKKIKGTTNILHVDSNLVLKSLEDKIIIGRYEDDEIKLLTSSDIELCNEWNFSFDNERVSNKEENEDGTDENEEENEDENADEQNEDENADEHEEGTNDKEEVQETETEDIRSIVILYK